MRMRSPRMAPPLTVLVGSIARIPSAAPSEARDCKRPASVLLPAPGGPVRPTRRARAIGGSVLNKSADAGEFATRVSANPERAPVEGGRPTWDIGAEPHRGARPAAGARRSAARNR